MFKAIVRTASATATKTPEGPAPAALRRRQILVAAADPSPLRERRMAALEALTGEAVR